MEFSASSVPPRPKGNKPFDRQRDTWRPSSVPPRARPNGDVAYEQRATARTRVRHDIEFSIEGHRTVGICRNLSLGGTAIQTSEPAPFGSRVTVFLELDGIDGEVRVEGTVRWSKPGVMGVQWDSLGARVTHAILRAAAVVD
jgi:hypothetical protein